MLPSYVKIAYHLLIRKMCMRVTAACAISITSACADVLSCTAEMRKRLFSTEDEAKR